MGKKWSDLQGDPIIDIKRGIELIRNEVGYQKPNPIVWRCECGWTGEVKDMPKHLYCPKCDGEKMELVLRLMLMELGIYSLHERRW